MNKPNAPNAEGELYRVYNVDGYTFEIRYGYYEESERGRIDPLPVFPDFIKKPVYTKDGRPLVTVIQPPCNYYKPISNQKEDWCGDCGYYADASSEISLCNCVHLKGETR